MLKKLLNMLSPKQNRPSPQEKAKAVYFALISQGNGIIQDICYHSPDDFKKSDDFKRFLAKETGVIMCLNSTKIGYESFFEDREEGELFISTIFYLFKNHLQIPWDVFLQYIDIGENAKEPDKFFGQLFSGRILAYISNQFDLLQNGKALFYVNLDTLIYIDIYIKIVKMVINFLHEFTSDSNSRRIKEIANDFDKSLK
jgi:hypothetical protein